MTLMGMAGCTSEPTQELRAVKGEKAPIFTLKNLAGEPVSLASAQGQVVLVEFWATWCPPCRESLPASNRLYEKYEDRGLSVIGIAVQDQVESVKAFVESEGIRFPMLMDDGSVSKIYGVRGIPALIFIDRKGIVTNELEGYRPSVDDEIENRVKELLEQGG